MKQLLVISTAGFTTIPPYAKHSPRQGTSNGNVISPLVRLPSSSSILANHKPLPPTVFFGPQSGGKNSPEYNILLPPIKGERIFKYSGEFRPPIEPHKITSSSTHEPPNQWIRIRHTEISETTEKFSFRQSISVLSVFPYSNVKFRQAEQSSNSIIRDKKSGSG